MDKRFDRLSFLISEDSVNKLNNKKILVLGVGGVGGYVSESLVRSGIGNITIVDGDKIDITNINRQVIALTSTIGLRKVDVLEKRIIDINPNCNVKKIDKFIDENNYLDLDLDNYDYIIDACDTISTKKLIIKYCLENNIKIISSMGAGNRMNPENLTICDIKKTSGDPLAKVIRKYLKDEHINKKLIVMWSRELPKKVDGVIASNSFVPASAGLLITSYVIKDLLK